MKFILDGNSENRSARKEQSLLFDLIKAFDYRSRAVTNWILFLRKPIFCHACSTYSDLPSNISTVSKIRVLKILFLGFSLKPS